VRRTLTALLALPLLAAMVACGDDDDTEAGDPTTTEASPTTDADGDPDGTGEDDDDGRTVATVATVYFARDEKVAAAGRTVSTPSTGRNAVQALLAGPDDLEADAGLTTAVPEGTELLDIDIDDGLATVDLSGDFAAGGGSLSMQLRVAQVVFTLTQFDSVDTVTILLDGEEATEGIGGEGVPATGVDRGDVENVTPFVLVTSPLPGQQVGSPLRIGGIANTFEANVLYEVVGPDGEVLEDGFTTATAGNGVWGEFSVTVDLDIEGSGLGTVVAYQDDAESGERRDVYEVPVRM
jgi:germination protein M